MLTDDMHNMQGAEAAAVQTVSTAMHAYICPYMGAYPALDSLALKACLEVLLLATPHSAAAAAAGIPASSSIAAFARTHAQHCVIEAPVQAQNTPSTVHFQLLHPSICYDTYTPSAMPRVLTSDTCG